MMTAKSLLKRFHIWRLRKFNSYQFLLVLSVFVGLTAGLAAVAIKNLTHLIQNSAHQLISGKYENFLFLIIPSFGIFITVVFLKFIIKKKVGHGIPGVLKAISRSEGKIPSHNIFSSIITSAVTVGFGGSVGLEGPTVVTGAAIGSNIGKFFHLNFKQTVLLLGCATAAAIASIFKAPITAIVLVIEILLLDLTASSILPLLISSVTGTLTSYLIWGQEAVYHFKPTGSFDLKDVLFYILLGIIAGFLSIYFSKIYISSSKFFKKIKHWYVKLMLGGLILGCLIFLFPSLYGEGYESVNKCLSGDYTYIFDKSIFNDYRNSSLAAFFILSAIVLLKVFASAATFGAGGIGGIYAPTLFIGANFGLLFAKVVNLSGIAKLNPSNFALVGMTAMISGVMHAPLTGVFLIAEITGGYQLFLPLIIVAAISFGTIKLFMPHSVYTIDLANKGELLTHNPDKNALALMRADKLIETNFKTIHINHKLRDLIEAISQSNRNVFPVVDDDNVFYGFVLLDDIRNIIFKQELYDEIKVINILKRPNEIITENDSIQDIAKMFYRSGKFNIVYLKDGKYCGFISRANFLSSYRRRMKLFAED